MLGAFLRRDWETELSYRAAFGLQLAASLLTLVLFYYLGQVVDPGQFESQGLSGGYFGYVAVGLALMQLVQAGLSAFARKLRDEQTTGTFEALMATPASPSLIILCSAAYDLLRSAVSGLVLLVVAAAVFGLRIDANPLSLAAAAGALVGCIALFAAIGVAVAAFTVVFKRALGLLALVGGILGLLGGVYFPLDVLPGPVEEVARALPFTWALDVARAGLLGGDVDLTQLGGLLLSDLLLIPASLGLFVVAVKRARQTGTLAQY